MRELIINGQSIIRGMRQDLRLPVASLYTDLPVDIPVTVIRSRQDGPTVFVCAAIHGDELNGIEIVRRLIRMKSLKLRLGTLILIPIVNMYGVLNQDRYMPDRRDLNRMFPGSEKGSLAGRVANRFFTEIVSQCDIGIDLHTGAMHRSNLPQVRAQLDDHDTCVLAETFGVPVLLNANLRDGSLREAASRNNVKMLLYEAGQALRFDELCIRMGVRGIMNVLSHLGMVKRPMRKKSVLPFIADKSSWVRSSSSGIVHSQRQLGDVVESNDVLATIFSPNGKRIDSVAAKRSGIIIGKQNIPLVHEGDALFHIAYFSESDEEVAEHIDRMEALLDEPLK